MSASEKKTSIAIYGAGAIGGHLGAMLSKAGFEVSLIARGDHLKAIEQHGLRLIAQDQDFIAKPRVTDDPSQLGPHDYVIMSLKSYQAPEVVEQMQPLLAQAEAMQRTGGFMPERSLSIDPVVMANNAVKQHFIQGSSLSVLKSLNAKLGSQTQMA